MHKYVLLMVALFVGLALWNVSENDYGNNNAASNTSASSSQVEQAALPQAGGSGNTREPEPPMQVDIGCDDAPEAAVTSLGQDLAKIATVKCSIFGHILAPPKGFVWNTGYGVLADLGGYPIPANLPAYIPSEEEVESGQRPKVGHSAYFTDIRVSTLGKPESGEVVRARGGKFATLADAELPEVTQLLAVNNEGVEQKIFFFKNFLGEEIGYFCRPECDAAAYFTAFEWLQASDIYQLDEKGMPLLDEEGNLLLKKNKE